MIKQCPICGGAISDHQLPYPASVIDRLIAEAIAREREACAKVLERRAEDVADTGSVMAVMALRAGAALIRARKDEPDHPASVSHGG